MKEKFKKKKLWRENIMYLQILRIKMKNFKIENF